MFEEYFHVEFHPKPKGFGFQDIQGRKYGLLKVIGYAGIRNKRAHWYCLCDCGTHKIIRAAHLVHGKTVSCGCKKGEPHGASHTCLHRIYAQAKARCNNPNNKRYLRYGGRGIKFLFNSFEEFFQVVGRRPSPQHTIDRIDNNGHYEKGNIQWATKKEQANNRSSNTFLTINNVRKTVAEWSEDEKSASRIFARKNLGWCDDCAVNIPLRGVCKHRLCL